MPADSTSIGARPKSGVERPVAAAAAAADTCGAEHDMHGFVRQCIERFCEVIGVKEETLRDVSTTALDDSSLPPGEWKSRGDLAPTLQRQSWISYTQPGYLDGND